MDTRKPSGWKQQVGRVHFLRDLSRAGVPPEEFDSLRRERWRLKNGLEHRTLVALLAAPQARHAAQGRLSVGDFLTPAYAALAAVILANPEDLRLLEMARVAAIEDRVYVPQNLPEQWECEAENLVGLMLERRDRWETQRRERWRLVGPRRPSSVSRIQTEPLPGIELPAVAPSSPVSG